MAQEVRLMGATYSDVPKIKVPDSNNTFHDFTDVSDTTATASDVANGKYFYTSNGTKTVGTASSAEEPTVLFYDYDGTVLHGYTAQQALGLTALPNNPSHSGLTAQGWNYTLAQMKAEVTAQGRCNVGQHYITNDGTTRIYIELEKGATSPVLGISPNGTVQIDWGDSSNVDTLTGTSLTTYKTIKHDYIYSGNYMITLRVVSGSFQIYNNGSTFSRLLQKDTTATTSGIHSKYNSAIKKIELGSNVSIGEYGFTNCKLLETITIPNTITQIPKYSFYNCHTLKALIVPNGVTNIGNYAICQAYSLKAVSISNSVTNIYTHAFDSCKNLKNCVIPTSITAMDSNAFAYCMSLDSIVVPYLSSTSESVFQYCYGLKEAELLSGCSLVPSYLFYHCESLKKITLPDTVTSIKAYAFNYCYSLKEINIPEYVTIIGNYAFAYCSALEFVDISETSIGTLGTYVFQNCQALKSVILPNGLTTIGTSCFASCHSLSHLEIPETVTSILGSAFSTCVGMTEYYFYPSAPPALTNAAFSSIQSDCVMYVSPSSLNAYKTANNWSTYASYMQAWDEA